MVNQKKFFRFFADEIFYKPSVARTLGSSDAAIIVADLFRSQGSNNEWVCLGKNKLAYGFGLTETQLQEALTLLRSKDVILEKIDPDFPDNVFLKIKVPIIEALISAELEKED